MKSGIQSITYSIDGQSPISVEDVNPNGGEFDIRFSPTYGYVTFEIWVEDIAGNIFHETYWYLLEEGIVKSVQPVYDGRFRVKALDPITLDQIEQNVSLRSIAISPNVIRISTSDLVRMRDPYKVYKVDTNGKLLCG